MVYVDVYQGDTKSELENKAFDRLLIKYGAEVLEKKVQKLKSTKAYYSRYPYDGWQEKVGLEYVDLSLPDNPHTGIIDKEAHNELIASLTPREKEVARLLEQGYRPMDIAHLRGKTTSNADRWIKHRIKEKFTEAKTGK